jgi:hypothetical protein
MNRKLLLSTLFGVIAWSISSVAAASWDTGACPQPHAGPAPCVETEINGNTYHFNGSGGHAGDWHGRPAAEGGGEFGFSGNLDFSCTELTPRCELTWFGEVKKCQDSTGVWRIGVRVTDANMSAGDFLCNFFSMDGFPWYSGDSDAASHCPFEDDCNNFIPYDPGAPTYTARFGDITLSASLIGILANAEHLHGVVFTPGVGANFAIDSAFFDCEEEEQTCSLDSVLTLDNGTSLDIY